MNGNEVEIRKIIDKIDETKNLNSQSNLKKRQNWTYHSPYFKDSVLE